ncbi:hypothetical protein [Thetidibacter halocola]|uniref:Uncharacterized protein n=1 Tax=Thetidibacter halocola TaxID=2827239 RepID=A0A8J7WCR0_9RHOB|nr:hypothetical protein [Thetidibacter halocola]MBS0125167.1 hypothetical protein [Thetidibacter halocola]
MFRPTVAFGLLLCLAMPAAALERRVYEGDEAKALKCVWIISRTAAVMEDMGIISPLQMEVSIAISARILALHVSGTEAQKLAALQAVGERRNTGETIVEFRDQAMACLRKFPVE